MFPTLSEAVTRRAADRRAAVLQQVDAADRPDPAAADRHRPAARVAQVDARRTCAHQFLWPTVAAVVTGGALVRARRPRLGVGHLLRAVRASSSATIAQEFVARRAACRKGATGTDILTALIGLVGRNKRRYGGYIVHVGIVLMFLGFAGQGFKQEEQVLLKPGQQVTVGRFTVRHDALRVTSDGQKQMVTGHVTRDRERQGDRRDVSGAVVLPQARGRADDRSRDPPRAGARTSTSCWPATTSATQTATYAVTINPLVNWIWLGFGVMALGTGIALLPETAFAFAAAKVPAGVPRPRACCCCSCCCRRRRFERRTARRSRPSSEARSERQLEGEIVCTCGCRRSLANCGMPNCEGHAAQTAKMQPVPGGRQGPRRSRSPPSSRSSAARTSCRRRSTRASTAWRGCSRI